MFSLKLHHDDSVSVDSIFSPQKSRFYISTGVLLLMSTVINSHLIIYLFSQFYSSSITDL